MNTVEPKTRTDIKRLVWIERTLPKPLRPYAYLMRIDRPIGIWLLLFPGLWSITLASGGITHFNAYTIKIIALFTIGALIMRSAGCVINDIWDRDLDKQVERTKTRPLPAGDITTKQALVFLATLLLLGLLILLQLNTLTIILGLLTIPLIIIYPLMKRITNYPQIILGIVFNFGALMGWSATTGSLPFPAYLLFIAGLLWTIGYDTIYAHQDIEDDSTIGIKSTALTWANNSKTAIIITYIGVITCLAAALFIQNGLSPSILLVALPACHLAHQIKTWQTNDPQSALKTFKSNQITALLILIACAI